MKVFFDSKISSLQAHGGISRLAFELIKSLDRFTDLEKLFYRGLYIDQYPYEKKWFAKYYRLKKPDFLNGRFINFLDNAGLEPAYNRNASPDLIYHSFYHRIPKKPKGPVVVHVYDMIQELFYDMPKATKVIQLINMAIEIDEDDIWNAIAEERDTENAEFISHEEFWK